MQDSQDEVLGFNTHDEPYLLQVAWSVTICQPGSAQAWVVGNRDNAYNMILPKIVGGGLYTLTGAKNFTQVFNGAGGQHTYTFAAGAA